MVDLTDSRVTGFEALLRWCHPDGATADAERFMNTAEETGMVIPMGWQALEAACGQARVWLDAGAPLPVSVNVSDRQFSEAGFVDQVEHILSDAGIEGSTVQLELTERVLIGDYRSAADRLEQCHALGLEVLIDDFGTGESSLTALHRLPIDGIKIDRSFIERLGVAEGAEIVEAILALARSLRLHVIAEGIETREQRDRLLQLGCNLGQGYLFAPALDKDEATSLLDNQMA
jgi:EAL domain-containing protein (putative c-di-GMP-specific phosphodiesterase class I)